MNATAKLQAVYAEAKRTRSRVDPVQLAGIYGCSVSQARKIAVQCNYRMSDYGKAETETPVTWARGRLIANVPTSALRAAGLDTCERLTVKAIYGRIVITAPDAQKPSANASERIGSSHNAI